jgi:predicted ATPase
VVGRIKSIAVSGFKSLGSIELTFDGLSVLIGENGSGKSSILEVLELLRCTTHENFVNRVASAHGGISQLREHGAAQVSIVAEIDDGAADPLVYGLVWANETGFPIEVITRGADGQEAVSRPTAIQFRADGGELTMGRYDSLVYFGEPRNASCQIVAEAFRGIEVHLPFQVTAHWATASPDRRTPRGISLLEPTRRLDRFGTNLVNAYQSLKNDFGVDHWKETLEYIHLGLGHEIRDVRLEAIPGGGHMALALETLHQGRVPAFSLADGVLSYLAFVALFRLDEGRTLLAFDEPELHLHPGLLMRVLGLFETMSDRYPVVISTHSDRLLDGLTDPAGSVVVTELDERHRTRLRHLDPTQLEQWIGDYNGLGELRADGELVSVLADAAEPSASPKLP